MQKVLIILLRMLDYTCLAIPATGIAAREIMLDLSQSKLGYLLLSLVSPSDDLPATQASGLQIQMHLLYQMRDWKWNLLMLLFLSTTIGIV